MGDKSYQHGIDPKQLSWEQRIKAKIAELSTEVEALARRLSELESAWPQQDRAAS